MNLYKATEIGNAVLKLEQAFGGMVDSAMIRSIMDIALEEETDVEDVREKARFLIACIAEKGCLKGSYDNIPTQTFTIKDILRHIDAKTIEQARLLTGGGFL